ncbi:uncharacterized protein LOC111088352 [Limulus polyphemus]|uniref:Uncharacterized protein LOC111088352 n=1 Tax=Limulus polyphemus TaxID=6850 RepID=A0ABM1TDJ1_LIMPO|nr:uncharacterized protein LOC111088352 [Limulus polyphemus]XP_022253947.1 uncharacterized protein LOC111088352 [Limulus polyphemus]XP_022253948.1 uncharacterized protein LOC111088352 [Limulus polyphemus]XP_022253949.1 uncharacterized protein LOC111088352 [Limulus polyphemus]
MIELKPILKKRNSAEELKGEVVGEQRPIMKKKSLLGDDVEEKPKSILKNRVRSQEESDIKTDIVRVTRPRSDSEPGIRSILKKSTFEDEPVKPLSILRPHFPDSSALKTSFDNLFVENKLPSILKNPLPLCHQEDDEKLLSKKDHLQNTGLNIFGDVEHPQSILKHRNFSQGDVTQTQPVLKKNSKDYSLSVVNQNIGLKSFMRTRRKSDSPESDMILASSVVIISSDKQCSNESSTSEAERTKCLQTEQRVIKSTLSHTDSAVQTTESGLG